MASSAAVCAAWQAPCNRIMALAVCSMSGRGCTSWSVVCRPAGQWFALRGAQWRATLGMSTWLAPVQACATGSHCLHGMLHGRPMLFIVHCDQRTLLHMASQSDCLVNKHPYKNDIHIWCNHQHCSHQHAESALSQRAEQNSNCCALLPSEAHCKATACIFKSPSQAIASTPLRPHATGAATRGNEKKRKSDCVHPMH
jgi:hypothetical protein